MIFTNERRIRSVLMTVLMTGAVSVLLSAGLSVAGMQDLKDKLYDNWELDFYGFAEIRQGYRIESHDLEERASLSEIRLQTVLDRDFGWGVFNLKTDFTGDLVDDGLRAELREVSLTLSPLDFLDLKIGRQTLTWGTGDLFFVNDLFPKNWESFFIGRDDEYLKAPSDAVKASLFTDILNADLVIAPRFNPSVYIDGDRLSYWNGMTGRIAGRDAVMKDEERDAWGRDATFSVRLSRNFGGVETALYGYSGFWSTPEGMKPASGRLYYPRLNVYGASLRMPLSGGIIHAETGYYDSREDAGADTPFVRNGEIRFLAGFERELAKNLTAAVQYYLEWMMDYDEYRHDMGGAPRKDAHRHVLTLRLTRLFLNQALRVSLFTYYSPSDKDAYLRPKVHYKLTDAWALEAGGNLFFGEDDHTFFGQFSENTNIYAGVRISF
ncbi:MAG: hypothetical protein CSB33_04545 [Desulfobacterales bacterium]|nr:MAG: hypothetical protein CSB33_04545 [Desulfobacterales bacterium]